MRRRQGPGRIDPRAFPPGHTQPQRRHPAHAASHARTHATQTQTQSKSISRFGCCLTTKHTPNLRCFEGLGLWSNVFFHSEGFRLHISKPIKVPGNICVYISKVILARTSSHRGLLCGYNLILSQKVVPQGPFV